MGCRLLFAIALLAPAAFAQEATAPSNHDLSYSVGASVGERLRQDMPELDLDALLQGLQQAYQQQPLALSQERMRQVLADHDAQTAETANTPVETALVAENQFLNEERSKPNVREISDGVLVTELSPGTGPTPSANSRVQVKYVGRLPDGSVFDQTDQPQWFNLPGVIEGWRIALQQMPKGARWRVVVPSAQAYGAQGAGGLIPPYTPLAFDIELLNVANPGG
ncbi:FKBP-type peptidyl-prolyl cis-trans isomerase [Pseudomonas typographi]|uniref:Peptidyl-prolyl cis-trans isomerase n=1 Tax=Pseudomonas typographi TaxID=2715964 RepID=A0ABR7Z3E4_9PSED|nr:FKBP-type peptidyl-prolyl cis-trans isomerase [Pseudomonas typographi]MBD1550174.1 FKBP-type peptidyl-prolyl cis-trans isomerase [Pseudomonas typographi]MBD1599924.1 FKBP-type peptidyl-prolyl cis-trans isomerase [Pseudomonas typographi]